MDETRLSGGFSIDEERALTAVDILFDIKELPKLISKCHLTEEQNYIFYKIIAKADWVRKLIEEKTGEPYDQPFYRERLVYNFCLGTLSIQGRSREEVVKSFPRPINEDGQLPR